MSSQEKQPEKAIDPTVEATVARFWAAQEANAQKAPEPSEENEPVIPDPKAEETPPAPRATAKVTHKKTQGLEWFTPLISGGMESELQRRKPPTRLGGTAYRGGSITAWVGHPNSGKTWQVLCLVHEGITLNREKVAILDGDDRRGRVWERLGQLGISDAECERSVFYRSLDRRITPDDLAVMVEQILSKGCTLFVLDHLDKVLSHIGLDSRHEDGISILYSRLLDPLQRAGVDCHLIDHLVKSTEGSSDYARGSGDKLANVDVQYRVSPKGAGPNRHRNGSINLTNTRDQDGHIVKNDVYVLTLKHGTDENAPALSYAISPPRAGKPSDEASEIVRRRAEDISVLLASNNGADMSRNAIQTGIGGNAEIRKEALALLIREGCAKINARDRVMHVRVYEAPQDLPS
jgi:hypothetical protein